MGSVDEWLRIVEPVVNSGVFFLVKLKLDGFERLDIQDVVTIVERRLLIVEGRETHALEVPTVSLLSPHSEPHSTPLRMVYGLNDTGNLVDERDSTRDVVEHWHLADLLPWVRDVLQKFHDRMRDVLESTEVNTLIVTELAVAHVTMNLDDFADMLRRQIIHTSE